MNQSPSIHSIPKPINRPSSADLSSNLSVAKLVQNPPTEFASALAHEIRNPLTNINLAVEILKATMIGEEQELYLDIIMRGSERINKLVYDLLAYYRTDKILFEKYSVHALIDEVLAMTNDRIKLRNIAVRKNYGGLDYRMRGDNEKIKIGLTNIIINAIDAMHLKDGELTLVTKSKNGRCYIEIIDNGIGISKENLKNIFKPYFTNKPGGMGLGLSTTLDILQSNHIDINVQSEEGKGTCFMLSFTNAQ